MRTLAVLDSDLRLVGLRKLSKAEVKRLSEDAIFVADECDLPLDGSYYWHTEDQTFMPIGHGLGRPKHPPISAETVLCLIIDQLPNPPQELLDWASWCKELTRDTN